MTITAIPSATHSTTEQSRDEAHRVLVDSVCAVGIAVLVIAIALGGAMLLVSPGGAL